MRSKVINWLTFKKALIFFVSVLVTLFLTSVTINGDKLVDFIFLKLYLPVFQIIVVLVFMFFVLLYLNDWSNIKHKSIEESLAEEVKSLKDSNLDLEAELSSVKADHQKRYEEIYSEKQTAENRVTTLMNNYVQVVDKASSLEEAEREYKAFIDSLQTRIKELTSQLEQVKHPDNGKFEEFSKGGIVLHKLSKSNSHTDVMTIRSLLPSEKSVICWDGEQEYCYNTTELFPPQVTKEILKDNRRTYQAFLDHIERF